MRHLILAMILLSSSPLTCATEPEDIAQRFLGAMADSSVPLEALFAPAFIEARTPDRLRMILSMMGNRHPDTSIHRLTVSTPEQIRFLARDRDERYMDITLDLDAVGMIAGMSIALAPTPVGEDESGLSAAELAKRIEALVDERAGAGAFSGAVLVAHGGEPLVARAVGEADRSTGRPNTLDTPFNLGSINKFFTGVAIAQLVEAGKLRYDATVGTYLPDFPNETIRDRTTLHHLLTHGSGLGSFWNDRYREAKDEIRSVAGFAAFCHEEPLAFEPGGGFQYSNCGPVVLGLIIEAVTGQTYYDYVREHVYGPAGLTATDHFERDETTSGKALGYHENEIGERVANTPLLAHHGSPAGGGYASANDLLRLAAALHDGRLLSADALRTMTTAKDSLPAGSQRGYGYLSTDTRINDRRYFGHNGGAPGINAEFSIFPDLDVVVIVLANGDRQASPVADRIRGWIGHAAL